MNTPDFDSSSFHANQLRKKVASFKRKEEEKKQRIFEVQSAFQYLSSTVMDFYREDEIGLLIGCEETVCEIELGKTDAYSTEKPINCSVHTLRFQRENVSVLFAPNNNNVKSGYGTEQNVMISFVLTPDVDMQLKQDHTGLMKPDESYKPHPNEQYTLLYSKGDGWSVNIIPRNTIKNPTLGIKSIDEKLTAESFLRMLSSVFSPVIA